MDGIEVLGRVDDEELWRRLHGADVLCAPSLGGESFGMVLTEAFAAGTPVVASDIAGYRQVVTHGRDGLLVPPGDPLELAEALRSLWLDPARRREMGVAARGAGRGLRVAAGRRSRSTGVYERAIEAPEPAGRLETMRAKAGLVQGDLTRKPAAPAGCHRSSRAPSCRRSRGSRVARRRPPRGARPVGDRRPAARLPRAAARGRRQRRHDARALEPDLGADRARRCSRPRCSCARSRGSTSCAPRCRIARSRDARS